MAARVASILRVSPVFRHPARRLDRVQKARMSVFSDTGSIKPVPTTYYNFGLLRLTLVVVPFLSAGAYLAKFVAQTLEEEGWFVPDDDDDD